MRHTLLLICLTALLSSCSPFALVNSETYNQADMKDYSTFRIVDPEMGKLPEGMKMVTYYNIAAAIREQMVERGYTEDPNSPLLINFGVTIHHEVSTEPAWQALNPAPPAGPGPGPYFNGYAPMFMYPRNLYWNPNAQVVTGIYKEGVLTVDMVNIDTMIPLFSASVATIINNGNGQYRNLTSISEAVNKLFSKFPVPLMPQYRNQN